MYIQGSPVLPFGLTLADEISLNSTEVNTPSVPRNFRECASPTRNLPGFLRVVWM